MCRPPQPTPTGQNHVLQPRTCPSVLVAAGQCGSSSASRARIRAATLPASPTAGDGDHEPPVPCRSSSAPLRRRRLPTARTSKHGSRSATLGGPDRSWYHVLRCRTAACTVIWCPVRPAPFCRHRHRGEPAYPIPIGPPRRPRFRATRFLETPSLQSSSKSSLPPRSSQKSLYCATYLHKTFIRLYNTKVIALRVCLRLSPTLVRHSLFRTCLRVYRVWVEAWIVHKSSDRAGEIDWGTWDRAQRQAITGEVPVAPRGRELAAVLAPTGSAECL